MRAEFLADRPPKEAGRCWLAGIFTDVIGSSPALRWRLMLDPLHLAPTQEQLTKQAFNGYGTNLTTVAGERHAYGPAQMAAS